MQEQQSTRGVDPQPEYYIDQIVQLTAVSHSLVTAPRLTQPTHTAPPQCHGGGS